MFKLFFLTFFIAELIIATAIILKIYKLDKSVNKLNKKVCENKPLIKELLVDIRDFIGIFRGKIETVKELIRRKKEEYMLNTLKHVLIYSSIILLKGKCKKAVMAYQFASEIYEAFEDFNA